MRECLSDTDTGLVAGFGSMTTFFLEVPLLTLPQAPWCGTLQGPSLLGKGSSFSVANSFVAVLLRDTGTSQRSQILLQKVFLLAFQGMACTRSHRPGIFHSCCQRSSSQDTPPGDQSPLKGQMLLPPPGSPRVLAPCSLHTSCLLLHKHEVTDSLSLSTASKREGECI